MKEKTVLETRIEELRDYSWLSYETDEDGNIEFITDEETIAAAAKAWKMAPAAVKAIKEGFDYFAETMIEAIQNDLEDMWKSTKNG